MLHFILYIDFNFVNYLEFIFLFFTILSFSDIILQIFYA